MDKTLWQAITDVSKRIDNDRTEMTVLTKVMEEVGELAQEVAIHSGASYKDKGSDGVVGEAIDAINALVDLIYIHCPDLTEADLAKIAETKQLKWEVKHIEWTKVQASRRFSRSAAWIESHVKWLANIRRP